MFRCLLIVMGNNGRRNGVKGVIHSVAKREKPSIVSLLFRRFFSDGVAQSAAELSYFLLFTLCPILMFLTSLLAQVHLPEDGMQALLQFVPKELQQLVQSYMAHIYEMPKVQPMIVGTGLTLLFLSRAVRSMMGTLNDIYRVHKRRDTLYRAVVSLLMAAGFLLAVLASMLLMVFGRTLFRLAKEWFLLPEVVTDMVKGASYPIAIGVLFLFMLVVNKVVPNVRLRWRDAAPGALFSLVIWLLFSYVFSYYVDNMAKYSLLYGSLGAIIVLMLWLYLSSIMLIMGAILNHILLLRRTGRDDPLVKM